MGAKLEKFWDKDLFVAEAKKRHGDKFNYDKTEPKGACSKVIVNCPVHGDYEVTANRHLLCDFGGSIKECFRFNAEQGFQVIAEIKNYTK